MSVSNESILVRLQSHLVRVANSLIAQIDEASEKHRGTPEAVAHARELALRAVITRFFPFPYRLAKNAIYDNFGQRSASIDCVICAPNHPLLCDDSGNIETLLVDGVHAAIELKPDLNDLPPDFGASRRQTPEIVRGLEQARTVKRLLRTTPSLIGKVSEEEREYGLRCPTYIVAQRSKSIEELGDYIAAYYRQNSVPLSEQVDVVFVLKNGLIVNSKVRETSLTHLRRQNGDWWPHFAVFENGDLTFAFFLLRLVSETPPELHMSRPVLWRYLSKMQLPKLLIAYTVD
jgi:hypothetical protein